MLSAMTMSGCAQLALQSGDFGQPTVRSSLGDAGIVDRQAEFAAVFCGHYARLSAQDGGGCGRWLPAGRAAASVSASVPTPVAAPAAKTGRSVVVIVPGIFGECVSRWVTPFSADYRYLEELGYQVLVVPVTGRGSSAVNAGIIHAFFAAHPFERAVVIGYSKGVTDFMLAAAQPQAAQWAGRVGAFVSMSGVVNGTPLASRAEPLYRQLASLPVSLCPPSDGGGVESLTYRSALPAAQAYAGMRKPYPSFSIAAVAEGGPVNPMLQASYDLLARLDRRNDGQVLLEDTMVPGSTFLGAFRADHWSIVLPFEDSGALEMRPFAVNNRFPRRALVTAVLDFVNR
jgi:pimeloyl-ACP methyl ester carboxylesterase